jgi:hypothetical protein
MNSPDRHCEKNKKIKKITTPNPVIARAKPGQIIGKIGQAAGPARSTWGPSQTLGAVATA